MTPEEVAMETGLDLDTAQRAKEREYDETVKLEGEPENISKVLNAINNGGLNYTHGGRYYNVMGGCDKGEATTILINLFQKKLGKLETIGIGDSLNDVPMLEVVDVPLLVQKPGGGWEDVKLPRIRRIEGIGPVGWKKAIAELLSISDR